jgi:hypothetical protein
MKFGWFLQVRPSLHRHNVVFHITGLLQTKNIMNRLISLFSLIVLFLLNSSCSRKEYVKSFQNKNMFNTSVNRLTDFGYKFKTRESDSNYEIVFKNFSKIDTTLVNELINSSGIINLHRAINKDSNLINIVLRETEKIEKLNSDIKTTNDSLRQKKSSKIIFYKTFLNNQTGNPVIGIHYAKDYSQLKEVLETVYTDDIFFSSYLPYLNRNKGIYELFAFEQKEKYQITSQMIESLNLEQGNKRDYPLIEIKLKPDFQEQFNKLQIENFKNRKVGFFLDNELLYCPTFGGYSIGRISIHFPTDDLAKAAYSVLKNSKENTIKKATKTENKLPNYYADNYYPNMDSLLKAGKSIESLVLLAADAVLKTPHDDKVEKRNDLFNFIIDWFQKKSNRSGLIKDNLAMKLYSIDDIVWGYYVVCMSKSAIEKPNAKDIDTKTDAVSDLIKYISTVAKFEDDSITNNEIFKELEASIIEKKLKDVLIKYETQQRR